MPIDELLELLGPQGLERLAQRHGGSRQYVPTTDEALLGSAWCRGTRLAEDPQGRGRLRRLHGGARIAVPLPESVRRLGRRRHAERLLRFRPDLSASEVARASGVSRRTVGRLRRERGSG